MDGHSKDEAFSAFPRSWSHCRCAQAYPTLPSQAQAHCTYLNQLQQSVFIYFGTWEREREKTVSIKLTRLFPPPVWSGRFALSRSLLTFLHLFQSREKKRPKARSPPDVAKIPLLNGPGEQWGSTEEGILISPGRVRGGGEDFRICENSSLPLSNT